jgi:GTPase SAR1 family protein
MGFLRNIKESIDEKKVKFILIGNKIDLEKKVSTEQGKKLADEYDMLFFEVSAKKNDNMKKMFYHSILEVSYFDEILKTQSKEELFKELIEENEGNLSKVDIISNHNSMIFDGVKTTGLNLNSVRSINDEKTEENKKEKNSCCMKKNNTK